MRGRGRGYLPQFFPRWLRPRTVELRGNPVGPFPASYPLTEAGVVLPSRGHTFGHLSVIAGEPAAPGWFWPGMLSTGKTSCWTASPPMSGRPDRPWAGCDGMSVGSQWRTCPPTTRIE
jgi:hypothetical protein